MKGFIFAKHFPAILAAGSVMEIWPTGDYSRYMPDPIAANSLRAYWMNVDSYVYKGIVQYGVGRQTRPSEGLRDE